MYINKREPSSRTTNELNPTLNPIRSAATFKLQNACHPPPPTVTASGCRLRLSKVYSALNSVVDFSHPHRSRSFAFRGRFSASSLFPSSSSFSDQGFKSSLSRLAQSLSPLPTSTCTCPWE
ncbi:uncharacterized protein LOC107611830 [Arachis ipaensis]|uniref:uncharacterized protein LOC107611830 n=1 Tax=Arachis ipaensis TaxID=130454 RepID=UPI000A2B217C|nr:uncharacterized protein LOC107611830 [Arachis ipaensis]XP_025672962.1 uncharacterized protein LOC112772270 [Arachis hypogaea]